MNKPTYCTRFAPPEMTPMNPDRANEARTQLDRVAQLLSDAILTNEHLWDENARLQAGIDTHLEKCAELRGQLGVAALRSRTAETLLRMIDPEQLRHVNGCPAERGQACDCSLSEIRGRLATAQRRIREGFPAEAPPA